MIRYDELWRSVQRLTSNVDCNQCMPIIWLRNRSLRTRWGWVAMVAGVQLEDDARMDGINYLVCSKCCHKSNLGSPVQTILTHILQIAASRSFTPPISDIRFYKRLTWYLSWTWQRPDSYYRMQLIRCWWWVMGPRAFQLWGMSITGKMDIVLWTSKSKLIKVLWASVLTDTMHNA